MSSEIRSAQVTDWPRIDQLYSDGHAPTLQGEGQTHPIRLWQMLTRTFSSLLPLATPSELLYVLEQSGKVMGFIQAEVLSNGTAARVRRAEEAVRVLNLSLAPELSPTAGGALIDHLCNEALEMGVARVYVRLPEGHGVVESFRAHGFVPYARDRVFYRANLDGLEPGDGPPGLRRARRKDLLGLFTLYLAVTPKVVSQMEAPDFAHWRLLYESEWLERFNRRTAHAMVVDAGELDGWLGVQPGSPGRPHTLSMLARSDSLAPALLARAVRELVSQPGPAWVNVRNYDTATTRVLQDAGFEGLAGQELFVRDMRAAARALAAGRRKDEKALAPAFGSM